MKSLHKQRKAKARQRRNRRCHNLGTLYGNAARLRQDDVEHDRTTLWMTLANFFGVNRGPGRTNRKDWDK